MGWLKRWFVLKYKLPPNHALFVDRSHGDLMLEMYEDMYAERDQLKRRIADLEKLPSTEGTEPRQACFERLNEIHAALDLPIEHADPLIAQWEAQLAAGQTPDLERRRG